MKIKYFIGFVALLVLCGALSTYGFAQSGQCVVNQIQGSLVTVTCPGAGTRVENIGGAVDLYKVGDVITLPPGGQETGSRGTRPGIDTKTGRR